METLLGAQEAVSSDDIEPDVIIDAVGLSCPSHVIKAKAELIKMSAKQVAQFVSEDKSCLYMVPKLIKSLHGYQVTTQYEQDGRFVFIINKGG